MKKKTGNLLFLAAVFLLTLWSVFHGQNLREVLQDLAQADWRCVAAGVLCVVGFILGESLVIGYLLRQLGVAVKPSHCCLYSFIGFFYSCITPSASGGQPMQIVAMRKDRIPVAVSAVVLAIVTITYKLVLVILGGAVVLLWLGSPGGAVSEVRARLRARRFCSQLSTRQTSATQNSATYTATPASAVWYVIQNSHGHPSWLSLLALTPPLLVPLLLLLLMSLPLLLIPSFVFHAAFKRERTNDADLSCVLLVWPVACARTERT